MSADYFTPKKTKLDLKNEDQAKLRRGQRYAAKWVETDEGKAAIALSAEFSALWRAQLAELQAIRDSF